MEAAQDDVQVKIGKMIFYITLAVSLWFLLVRRDSVPLLIRYSGLGNCLSS